MSFVNTPKGYLALVLHAHLPFVRHPEHHYFLEENWLYEAMTETYIPLLEIFEKIVDEKIDMAMTMTMTPTLISMLADPLLQERFQKHINQLIELAEKEIMRTRFNAPFSRLAHMYLEQFLHVRDTFLKYNGNLIHGFKRLQQTRKLEIITCTATHGYLPLMNQNEQAMYAQIEVGKQTYAEHFGEAPRGIWLAECAYTPQAEKLLEKANIRYFLTETHGVLFATPRPKYGVYAPIQCTNTNVKAFARDLDTSKQVWSADEGYPGDYDYREYYRDIGFDLELDYIKPYIHPDGIRVATGIKYHRITGKTNEKQIYNPDQAKQKAAIHAAHFMSNRQKQIEYLHQFMTPKPPIIVAPYDAELFGHWWFEGPWWLDYLIRKVHYDQDTFKLITPSQYLEQQPNIQICQPAESSWGYKGYHEVWLNDTNDWIYRHLHQAASQMTTLARQFPNAQGVKQRALNQAAREVLLAQSSDWAFIMKTGTVVEYAKKRTRDHLLRFHELEKQIRANSIDITWLEKIENSDNLFPNINYQIYI